MVVECIQSLVLDLNLMCKALLDFSFSMLEFYIVVLSQSSYTFMFLLWLCRKEDYDLCGICFSETSNKADYTRIDRAHHSSRRVFKDCYNSVWPNLLSLDLIS